MSEPPGLRSPGAGFDRALVTRLEDAGLNASAPPQQRWLDGWIVRTNPGKAKRARCVNAVAEGRLPLEARLAQAARWYREADLPLIVRITPTTCPGTLDDELARRGWALFDDTRVMARSGLAGLRAPAAPAGFTWSEPEAPRYAACVGTWRGSVPAMQEAHAQRLRLSPVPYQALLLHDEHGRAVAGGQRAQDGEMVGLYDVYTVPEARGRGLARLLCLRLLADAAEQGARVAYLQVEADNAPARAVYQRLGLRDAYAYHYRQAPDHADVKHADADAGRTG